MYTGGAGCRIWADRARGEVACFKHVQVGMASTGTQHARCEVACFNKVQVVETGAGEGGSFDKTDRGRGPGAR